MVKACCVPGCKSGVNVPSHKFPKNEVRCFRWIESLKLDHLKQCAVEHLQKFKVCHKHFSSSDYSCSPRNRFLLSTAVPVTSMEIDNDVQNNLHPDEAHDQPQQLKDEEEIEQHNLQPANAEDMILHRVAHLEQIVEEHKKLLMHHQEIIENNVQNKAPEENVQTLGRKTEQTSASTKRLQRRPNLQNVTRVAKLSPGAKPLYNMIIKLRRRNKRLKRLMQEKKDMSRRKTISLVHTDSTIPVRERFINMILENNDVSPQVRNINNIPIMK